MDGIEEFKGAMRAHGLNPPEIIEPGKLQRFPTNGKRHDDAGWCKLFADGGGGVFGDFRSGRSETWQAKREKPFTSAEGEAFRQRCKAECRAREAEEARRHADAREKAAENLAAVTGDPATHLYAIKKRVPFGPLLKRGAWPQRGWTDALLVPIYGGDGCLWSIEAINSDGGKDFLAGSRIGGGFHSFGKVRGADRVLVGEGLANVAVCVAAEPVPAAAGLYASIESQGGCSGRARISTGGRYHPARRQRRKTRRRQSGLEGGNGSGSSCRRAGGRARPGRAEVRFLGSVA